jgi:hypothetical protein
MPVNLVKRLRVQVSGGDASEVGTGGVDAAAELAHYLRVAIDQDELVHHRPRRSSETAAFRIHG